MIEIILFLCHRPLPPLPDLEISEKTIAKLSDVLQIWLNQALSVAHDIAINRNLFLCAQVLGYICFFSLFMLSSMDLMSIDNFYIVTCFYELGESGCWGVVDNILYW